MAGSRSCSPLTSLLTPTLTDSSLKPVVFPLPAWVVSSVSRGKALCSVTGGGGQSFRWKLRWGEGGEVTDFPWPGSNVGYQRPQK